MNDIAKSLNSLSFCLSVLIEGGSDEQKPEELNKRALAIIQRVKDKLTGIIFTYPPDLYVCNCIVKLHYYSIP